MRTRKPKRGSDEAARKEKKHPREWYPTPFWVVDALFACAPHLLAEVTEWIDPCAGDGAILRRIRERHERASTPARRLRPVSLEAWDLRPECEPFASEIGARFEHVDMIAHSRALYGPHGLRAEGMRDPTRTCFVTNFPFSMLAAATITFARYAPRFVTLAPIDWLTEASWMSAAPPSQIIGIPNRISFSGDGKCDGRLYAWAIWEAGIPSADVLTVWSWAPKTSLEVRKLGYARTRASLERQTCLDLGQTEIVF